MPAEPIPNPLGDPDYLLESSKKLAEEGKFLEAVQFFSFATKRLRIGMLETAQKMRLFFGVLEQGSSPAWKNILDSAQKKIENCLRGGKKD